MKKLTVIGLCITVLWLGAFAVVLWIDRGSASRLTLNEWGDFLAGVTAPLALIWIVIGYFLQGEELRLNTLALEAQQEELRKQVAETAILAKNSERQAIAAEQLAYVNKDEAERAALHAKAETQPVFRVARPGTSAAGIFRLWITNVGALVRNVTVATDEPDVTVDMTEMPVFEQGRESKLRVSGANRFPFQFTISYDDTLGQRHTKIFQVTNINSFHET